MLTDCKNLIARMLVTDPKERATLHEIINHPWVIKGFGFAPESHLPAREPVQLPLDDNVVKAMTGFDFGAPELIHAQLTKVLESEDYQRAVRNNAREREHLVPNSNSEKKRGFGFDFYKRRNSMTSRDTLGMPSSEGLQLGTDPINAFSPLISVYYLVREKQDRDRLAANPGATSMPREPGEAPLQQPMPDLAAPKAAYTNAAAYEMPGEKATGGRSRPRARTHGEDEVSDAMKHVRLGATSRPVSPAVMEPAHDQPARKESAAAGLLRRFSTRKRREPERIDRDRPMPPMVNVQAPNENGTIPKKSFSVRRTRESSRDAPPASTSRSGSTQPQPGDLLTPPRSSDHSRTPKGLGRSTSVNSADYRKRPERRNNSEAPPRVTYKEPPRTSASDQSTMSSQNVARTERIPSENEGKTSLDPRSATTRTKSLGHARRESIQARRMKREEAREGNVPEETDHDVGDNSGISTDRVDGAENVKPVFLKGLFSVSTTSTKSVHAIRADIIRVLKQLGVDYTEIRGGFSCRHMPSIDLNRVTDNGPASPTANGLAQAPSHRRRISFGGMIGISGGDRDRDEFRESERMPPTPRTPRRNPAETSYTNSDASDESIGPQPGSSRRVAGETTTHVQSDLGGSMVLRFEIFIVKVPLLSLHGVQFKRLAGGTWQYKNMADKILRELRL